VDWGGGAWGGGGDRVCRKAQYRLYRMWTRSEPSNWQWTTDNNWAGWAKMGLIV
jgi:hypothetical protein